LIAGGLLYTIGAVIYGTKWPPLKSKIFGFHEIFHLFVLYGSFCHFWLMFRYLLYIR
jgi:hemolysin III